jgi:signal transduction histidine kinase
VTLQTEPSRLHVEAPINSRLWFRTLSVQTILIIGFLLTAGTWLFAGSFFGKRIQEIQREAREVGRQYTRAQSLLSETRAEVYRASIVVRDALLDPKPDAARYRADVEKAYRRADDLLTQYASLPASGLDLQRAERLRRDVADLRDANLGVLSTDSRRWRENASELILTRIRPKREAAILVTSDLQALNRNAYVEQQTLTATLYQDIQERFWKTFGLAVIATFCIALFSAVHLNRLERILRLEQAKDARTALELQRLSAQLVSAQEEERRTIARELHDEIGQVLTVVKIELSHAQRYIASLGGKPDSLDDARSITHGALDAVRDISHFLHPSVLDDLGLPAAVDGYLQHIRKRQDLRVEFTAHNMATRLPSEMELALYRIVQEGLTNVLRHARAQKCTVELVRDNAKASIRLTVGDDGIGFGPTAPRGSEGSRGLGLVGIRERVAQLGGQLSIDSAPKGGTRLVAEFPVPVEASPSAIPSLADVIIKT